MHNLQELKIWTKAIDLATAIYKATGNFPQEEKYGLTSQIRRSAVSIPSNIAEGAGRNSSKEFCTFSEFQMVLRTNYRPNYLLQAS
jgi:four helix bundle protein